MQADSLTGNTEINLCMGKSYSLQEIIDTAEKITGKELRLIITDSKAFRGRDLNVRLINFGELVKKPLDLVNAIVLVKSCLSSSSVGPSNIG